MSVRQSASIKSPRRRRLKSAGPPKGKRPSNNSFTSNTYKILLPEINLQHCSLAPIFPPPEAQHYLRSTDVCGLRFLSCIVPSVVKYQSSTHLMRLLITGGEKYNYEEDALQVIMYLFGMHDGVINTFF